MNQKENTTKSPRRIAAIELLKTKPQGAMAAEIFAALGYSTAKDCAKMLSQLRLIGHIKSVFEGTQQSARRCRYYVAEHEATALKKNREGKGKTWGMGRAVRTKAQTAAGYGTKLAIGVETAKRTVVQAPVDMRFKVDAAEPFFSKMRPGEYMEADSAIKRAYA